MAASRAKSAEVSTPPVETPPIEAAPVETPPIEAAPVETTSVTPRVEEAPESAPVEAGEATTPASPVEPEVEVEVELIGTFVMNVTIGGTRNGEPWPKQGETVDLPLAEAAGYLSAGYITLPPE